MKNRFTIIMKKHPVFRLSNKSPLEDKLSAILMSSAFLMSFIGFITNALFGYSFILNLPNLLVAFILLTLPLIFPNELEKVSKFELFIVAVLYFPYIYFTNNAYLGAAPIYFTIMIVYLSFYLKNKELFVAITTLVIFYSSLFIFTYNYPDTYIEYPDTLTGIIDYTVALVLMSVVVAILGTTTYRGYRKEKTHTANLMEQLEIKNKELEILTNMDHLTKIYNRKYFMEQINKLIKHNNSDFYILMIDIDDFKKINDKYGHLFGDDVLMQIAKNLSKCLRTYDTLSRYGGEEFAVLLTNNTIDGCYQIAERMRSVVSALEFRYEIKVTISIGVSKFLQEDSIKDVIDRADKNLYIAKEKGKNQVQ